MWHHTLGNGCPTRNNTIKEKGLSPSSISVHNFSISSGNLWTRSILECLLAWSSCIVQMASAGVSSFYPLWLSVLIYIYSPQKLLCWCLIPAFIYPQRDKGDTMSIYEIIIESSLCGLWAPWTFILLLKTCWILTMFKILKNVEGIINSSKYSFNTNSNVRTFYCEVPFS